MCGRKGCAEVPEQGQFASARRKEQTEEATLYDYLIGELTRGEREAPGIGWESSKSKGASALKVPLELVYRLFGGCQSGRNPNFEWGIVWARQRDSRSTSLRAVSRLQGQRETADPSLRSG